MVCFAMSDECRTSDITDIDITGLQLQADKDIIIRYVQLINSPNKLNLTP